KGTSTEKTDAKIKAYNNELAKLRDTKTALEKGGYNPEFVGAFIEEQRLVGGLLNMYSEKLRAQEIKEDPTYWKAQNYKLAAAKFERDLAADAAKAAGAVGSVGTPYTAGDKEKEYDFAKLVKKDEAFL